MNAIETKNLTKIYKEITAVKSLNLEIKKGELFALLGVNGAGKTTTIKMLSCLLKPTSGDAIILGESILDGSDRIKQLINISPQETAIAPNLSVRENLELISRIYGKDKKEAKEKASKMITEYGFSEIENKKAKTLSGGWKRRLSISLALISEPEILFLDEPTLGLDVLARRELWDVIRKLKDNTTIILTTHYLEEAEALSDRIAVMSKGALKAVGTAKELIALTSAKNFEDAFVALAKEEVAS